MILFRFPQKQKTSTEPPPHSTHTQTQYRREGKIRTGGSGSIEERSHHYHPLILAADRQQSVTQLIKERRAMTFFQGSLVMKNKFFFFLFLFLHDAPSFFSFCCWLGTKAKTRQDITATSRTDNIDIVRETSLQDHVHLLAASEEQSSFIQLLNLAHWWVPFKSNYFLLCNIVFVIKSTVWKVVLIGCTHSCTVARGRIRIKVSVGRNRVIYQASCRAKTNQSLEYQPTR
jgi:hypothetical protein